MFTASIGDDPKVKVGCISQMSCSVSIVSGRKITHWHGVRKRSGSMRLLRRNFAHNVCQGMLETGVTVGQVGMRLR